jgi:hypothetical protein
MSRLSIARRAALVVVAAAGVCGLSSTAAAQRTTPRPALGPTPAPPVPPAIPYPGATVTVDQRAFEQQRLFLQQRFARSGRRQHNQAGGFVQTPIYYPTAGYGGASAVTDVNGRPLWNGYDGQSQQAAPVAPQSDFPMATPDLSGSPYVVIDGGTMVVDFGNGDRRAVPACGAVEKASTPDGQPRTIFYRPPTYSLVLRPGQRGQVLGRPTAGARVCYTMDGYGRTVLAY